MNPLRYYNLTKELPALAEEVNNLHFQGCPELPIRTPRVYGLGLDRWYVRVILEGRAFTVGICDHKPAAAIFSDLAALFFEPWMGRAPLYIFSRSLAESWTNTLSKVSEPHAAALKLLQKIENLLVENGAIRSRKEVEAFREPRTANSDTLLEKRNLIKTLNKPLNDARLNAMKAANAAYRKKEIDEASRLERIRLANSEYRRLRTKLPAK